MLVDELADVEQEAVNSIIAVELNAPEVFTSNLDGLDRCEPP
jgi:hypothetical protein